MSGSNESVIRLTLAHSPDADDAFMFYALAGGKIDLGPYRFEHVLKDIETLNRAAEQAVYDITALSVFGYAFVAKEYVLLDCGASVGDNYGPIVVCKKTCDSGDLAEKVIAVPGTRTTAFLSLALYLGRIPKFVEVPFDQIIPAVKDGNWEGKPVDAGLVIHEGQLSYSQEDLVCLVDLGRWWKVSRQLPLPLGVNAIRRSLGVKIHRDVVRLIRQSILYGLQHRAEALDYAAAFGRGLDRASLSSFVAMYVNEWTVSFPRAAKRAMSELFWGAYRLGLLKEPVLPEFVGENEL